MLQKFKNSILAMKMLQTQIYIKCMQNTLSIKYFTTVHLLFIESKLHGKIYPSEDPNSKPNPT
jgi:hypothetical protein